MKVLVKRKIPGYGYFPGDHAEIKETEGRLKELLDKGYVEPLKDKVERAEKADKTEKATK